MAAPFRLARVLRLRTQLRKLVQDEVALLGGNLATVRERIEDAAHAQVELHEDAGRALAGAGLTGGELAQLGAWAQALAARETALVAEGERVAAAIVRGREELVARRREERTLERLRERTDVRAQAEELRAEAILLDELALRQRSAGEGRR
jgi:flagellar export protein FliJ